MKIITQYIAEDGKIFSNEEACARYEYEMRLTKFADTILLFDRDFQRLELNGELNFDDVYCVACKTDEAARDLYNEFCHDYIPFDTYMDCRAGIWHYIDSGWTSIEETIQDTKILLRIADETFGDHSQYLL